MDEAARGVAGGLARSDERSARGLADRRRAAEQELAAGVA
jgi:hypothetical protein